eukprot:gnl/MRDRNA2_/MRDRNA2_272804_c0_seq1.p1 gnl/MRDRNA2_/MRDRNA2_272804_c0~~gnl/MRDRNA2_/MRDRNA2_272804_c0_seq1.p1  ORF type:complete len:143 (+),score=11.79 gnl/MRDRNA2_/MRDRNA2_272804_c0_seq1:165-593(+)
MMMTPFATYGIFGHWCFSGSVLQPVLRWHMLGAILDSTFYHVCRCDRRGDLSVLQFSPLWLPNVGWIVSASWYALASAMSKKKFPLHDKVFGSNVGVAAYLPQFLHFKHIGIQLRSLMQGLWYLQVTQFGTKQIYMQCCSVC